MTRAQPSDVVQDGGSDRDGEAETYGQLKPPQSQLLSPPASQELMQNRPRAKRRLVEENREEDLPTKIVRIDKPSPSLTIDGADLSLRSLHDGTLCSRCIGLDFSIPKDDCPSFKVVSRLGSVEKLLGSPNCDICQLLYKVRPVSSKANLQVPLDCSLVLFDGKWARPWKARTLVKNSKTILDPSKIRADICFDTFATMDNDIMFGILPTEEINDPRSNTVPYLHDSLYESLTKSGYIRVAHHEFPNGSKEWGPKPVASKANLDFLRVCIEECAYFHSKTCLTEYGPGYNPLNIIDCRTRKVVKFPRGVRYLALSYIWG